MSHVTTA